MPGIGSQLLFRRPDECPDTAKIGTFSIGTPALPTRLEGYVYLGEPKPGDQYRLFLTASGFGMNVKFEGSVFPIRRRATSPPNSPTSPRPPLKTSSSISSPANGR